jgi:hypothetical protein
VSSNGCHEGMEAPKHSASESLVGSVEEASRSKSYGVIAELDDPIPSPSSVTSASPP